MKGYRTETICRVQEGASYEDIEAGDAYETAYIVYDETGEIIWDTTNYENVRQYFESEESKSYSKGGKELRVKTKWGDLVATVGYDSNYPEIFISLEMADNVDFTLALIGQDGDTMRTRIKEYIPNEDFTSRVDFTDDEIQEAWQQVIDDECYDE